MLWALRVCGALAGVTAGGCAAMRSEHPELASPAKRCFLLFGRPRQLFLGPGFRLVARWNRLVETVKTRKERGKTGGKWARYGLKGVKDGS